MLLDDRQKYGIGGLGKLIAKMKPKSLKTNKEMLSSDMLERGIITPEDAVDMLNKKEIRLDEAEKYLLASGYSSKDVNTFLQKYMEDEIIKDMSKSEIKLIEQGKFKKLLAPDSRLKELEPPSKKEIDDMLDEAMEKGEFAEGGSVDASMDERNTWQEGGDVDEQMSMLMTKAPTKEEQEDIVEESMESDEEMEENYLDFIIDEALTEEEEDMLMSKLEQDEELSMLFDKVIEVASEFAGSGPVEGPGTGVSDSIPARLSDGEFVFTAKAVEEIGADELMRMMKDAEARADGRQEKQMGGLMARNPMPEDDMNPYAIQKDELDDTNEAIKRGMIYNQIPIR